MNIPFAGAISPKDRSDIRVLYELHVPWTRELLLLLGVAATAAVLFPDQVATYLFHIPPAQRAPMTIDGKIVLLSAAALLVWAAFCLPRAWWRWWWPKFEQSYGNALSGQITAQGVQWGSDEQVIPWRRFAAAKYGGDVVLLYLTRAYPLPFHRSMFANTADWEAFLKLIKQSKVRLYHFRQLAT